MEGRAPDERFTADHLYGFEESVFGPWPWAGHDGGAATDWLRIFWNCFSSKAKMANPGAEFYAEKAPVWLTPLARQVMPCSVVYLFRDPRDVYLSANAFMKQRSYYGFHRTPADTDLDHARILGLELVNYFENFEGGNQAADFCLLRYEDLISDPSEFLGWLQKLGIALEAERAFEQIEGHQTSSSPGSSVGRWQREYISPEISSFFEIHLGREMRALGYPVESRELCPSIEFRVGQQPVPELSNPAHGSIERSESAATVHLTGNDFGILVPFDLFEAEEVSEVWLSASGTVGDHFTLYWRGNSSHFSEERSIHVYYSPGSHWRVIRFRVRLHPFWKGTVQQLRVDLFNGGNPDLRGTGKVRWLRLIR